MENHASLIKAAHLALHRHTSVSLRRFSVLSIAYLLVLSAISIPNTARAQAISFSDGAGEQLEVEMDDMDLSDMTKKQWRHLRSEQLAALRSKDPRVRQDAVRNIIYLTRFHGEQVDFKRASLPLLNIYIFDRNEENRIVALAGLHAVGSRNVMAHLAQRVRLEGSPRVRRLTIAALVDYYRNGDHHSDREAVVTGHQLAGASEE